MKRTAFFIVARPPVEVQHTFSRLQHQQRHASSISSSTGAAAVTSCSIYEDDQLGLRTEDVPLPVWKAMHALRAAGHSVLLVGGAVRDLLLGHTPKDYDLLTSARLAEVKQLLPRPRIFGRSFPIAQLDWDGVRIEVSSMRTRSPTRLSSAGAAAAATIPPDAAQILQAGPQAAVVAAAAAAAAVNGQIGRHRPGRPAAWQRQQQQQWLGQTAQQLQQQQQQRLSWAAARRDNACGRDFTVNCLLYDPFAGLLFDYVGGVADAHAKLLRCNGDAVQRFRRDPACMLRAVRCAARAGLAVEAATLAGLQAQAPLLQGLNSHRLTAELTALLAYGAAAPSMHMLAHTQLLEQVLPPQAAYMLRQPQQQGREGAAQQAPCHSSCSSLAGNQHPGSSSSRAIADAGVSWQQLQKQDAVQARSALGKLWSGQQPTAPPNKQLQQLQHQHQQLQDTSNLLLHVLACLDQHVSVVQPAPAEVVLACLTAPLLVESLTEAATQLQQRAQQLARRRGQQSDAAQRQQHQQQHQQQQQHQHQQLLEQQELWRIHAGSAGLAADTLALLLHPLPAACSLARPFSSSSSSSGGGSTGAAEAQAELMQQLLAGAPVAACIQQHACHIASLVCRRMPEGDALQEQQAYPAAHSSSHLFGVHAPRLTAELLASHMQLSQQQCTTQPTDAAEAQQLHVCGSSGINSSKSSKQQRQRTASAGLDLWDEYAAALPRSNKQFRQLMQRQWDEQLRGAEAGYVGTLGADADMTAGAEAWGGWGQAGGLGADSGTSDDDEAAAVCSRQLLHQVLGRAGLDLGRHEQQLLQLQAECLE